MNKDEEILRLRALVEYAATSLESLGIMLAAAEKLRQAPFTELIDPILEGAQQSANMLWSGLAEITPDANPSSGEAAGRILN